MDTQTAAILFFLLGGLLSLFQLFLGLLIKEHNERDNERHRDVTAEILRIREKVHALSAAVSKLGLWQNLRDEDDKK